MWTNISTNTSVGYFLINGIFSGKLVGTCTNYLNFIFTEPELVVQLAWQIMENYSSNNNDSTEHSKAVSAVLKESPLLPVPSGVS